jgi:hypothetical protein
MEYVGIDWAYRRAAWCALGEGGAVSGEGVVAADEDGLARLVLLLGVEVRACVEMMSGAVWVRDRLAAIGWRIDVAPARKVRDIAPLACKTDKVDARVLAELCRGDLVPALWVAPLEERALREQLRRRMHLVRLRASAMNRIFGLLTQWGLRVSLARLRASDAVELLADRGVDATWRRSIAEALAVIEPLDGRGVSEDLCRHERKRASCLRGRTAGSSWRGRGAAPASSGASPKGERRETLAARARRGRCRARLGGALRASCWIRRAGARADFGMSWSRRRSSGCGWACRSESCRPSCASG